MDQPRSLIEVAMAATRWYPFRRLPDGMGQSDPANGLAGLEENRG
jgi:hypothetical protein